MLEKVEHIGIAVKNLHEAEEKYTYLLGVKPYKREEVKTEKVITSFFRLGETKIELLAATSPESPIARFIEKRGEGIHHIAYATDDIKAELKRLEKEGFEIITPQPKKGADNKLVAFIHPRSAGGVLIELCQDI